MKTLKIILLCCIIAGSLNLSAQIIYTDIIPDLFMPRPLIPNPSGDTTAYYGFDVNNDSITDFTFSLKAQKWYDSQFDIYHILTVEYIDPIDSLYIILEDYNCMKILELYDTIDINQLWSPSPEYGAVITGKSYFSQSKNWICNPPNSNKYCGFNYFSNGNNNYGWIRLSWGDTYVTVHDFAINLTPNTMLWAGQEESTGVTDYEPGDFFNIKYKSGQIVVTSNSAYNKILNIRIINLSGQCVKELEYNNSEVLINTKDITQGLYIIQITQADKFFAKKVFISNL